MMGSAEGLRPFAGGLGVPPRYNFLPLPDQEGGQGDAEGPESIGGRPP